MLQDMQGGADTTPPEIWVAQLPPDLTTEISILPESQVLGSISSEPISNLIILETPLSPQAIRDRYQTELIALGWEPLLLFSRFTTFGFSDSSAIFPMPDVFCQPTNQTGLFLFTTSNRSQTTTVRLSALY
ncbi:MAG: hypothetical protein AAF921_12740 [Cyanobacteria bacterium P01_D01_bin.44]